MVSHGHTKKRDLLLCSAFINKCQTFMQIKKRDCVLLFLSRIRSNDYFWEFSALRDPGIALLFRTSNTEVHAEYVHARVYLNNTRAYNYISWGHQLLQCLGIKIEFTRFRKAKNKALRTPTYYKGRGSPFWRLYTKCLESRDWGLWSYKLAFREGTLPTL